MFQAPVDIANRALQILGVQRIQTFSDDSKAASEASFAYDKIRRIVLQRNIWRETIRTVTLRAMSSTSKVFTPSAWAVGTTYAFGDLATYATTAGTLTFQSLIASNTGNIPGDTSTQWALFTGPATCENWSSSITYTAGEIVYVSSVAYLSLANSNLNHAPASGNPWLALTGTLAAVSVLYPLGAGVVTDTTTRNIYSLPVNFMREAQQDPKSGIMPIPGAVSAVLYRDWRLENGFLLTRDGPSILYRYTTDILSVPSMDDLLCEAISCRLAMAMSETLTQAVEKTQMALAFYKLAVRDARAVNSIELGSTEMPEEDFYLLNQPQQQAPQSNRQG